MYAMLEARCKLYYFNLEKLSAKFCMATYSTYISYNSIANNMAQFNFMSSGVGMF